LEPGFALLLPLVGGYLYVVGYSATQYLIAREEGDRLYFRVALTSARIKASELMTRQQAPEIAVEGDQMLRLVDDGRR